MKSILIIGPFFPPLTGVSVVNHALKDLLPKGKVNTINTHKHINLSSGQGSGFSLKKSVGFFSAYLQIGKIFRSDVVYLTPGQTFFGVLKYAPFIILSCLLRKPIIFHLHGNYLGREYEGLNGLKKYIFRFLISRSSEAIVLSEGFKQNFGPFIAADKIHVLKNFVTDEIADIDISEKDYSTLKLLYLSNLMKEKGILDFLDALAILKNRNINFQATIAGAIESDIVSEVEDRLSKLNGNVRYLHVVLGREKETVLKESNIFVLPTYYKMEGQPISLLEAMAAGNAVIVTRHAGIPEIVSERNGLFAEANNPEDLADKIISLFQSENLKQIGNNNKILINTAFRQDIFSKNISDIFNRISPNSKVYYMAEGSSPEPVMMPGLKTDPLLFRKFDK
ncbi:MAG: glycosyltransferase family 4 protein [Cytophagaceae bacterium]